MPASDRNCRVYVGNLPWKAKWQDLKDHMRHENLNIIRADILEDNNGRSRGCGIVEYATQADARSAIERLNDSIFLERMIFVREDREDGDKRGGSGSSGSRPASRSVGGGGYNTGPPYSGGANRGFHGGSSTGYSSPGGPDENTIGRQVFVGNLPWKTSWQDLKDYFRQCGEVVRAEIYTERFTDRQQGMGKSKGCGIVIFKKQEDALKACEQLSELEFGGRRLMVRMDEGPPSKGQRY